MTYKLMTSLFMLATCTAASAQTAPYMDAALTPEQRATDLLPRLTLDEKIGMMEHTSRAVPRLGIKAYNWWNEALHGVARTGLATVFPEPIGMAASFDDGMVQRVFSAVSDEARVKYHKVSIKKKRHDSYEGLSFWTPNVNIFRDPRWGRGQETYGEDPYLTSRMGVAVVHGLQGPDTAHYTKTFACAKHFAVHSGPEWNRHSFNVEELPARDLWETYLPAFKALVQEAHVKQVMCAYNRLDGQPCCGNNRLLHQILREEWGYKGIVVSDCWAVSDFYVKGYHETHPDVQHAIGSALGSGTDLECGSNYRNMGSALKMGLVTEAKIDSSVKRLLMGRFELGEMDDDALVPWNLLPESLLDCKEHRLLALEAARKSIVLLQNRNNLLPLKKEGKNIIVMGPNANDAKMQWGNYNGTPSHTVTILQGIRDALGQEVEYVPGCPIVTNQTDSEKAFRLSESTVNTNAKVKNSDIVIFVGGISPRLEGEEMKVTYPGFRGGDRTDIELPAVQRNMLKMLKAAGKKVVLICCSGSAMGLVPETENCDAILQAWYPGQEGGTAVADVIFGKYNPAGRLPVTFYRNIAQLPAYENYTLQGRTYRYMTGRPLFPFGFGLSYSTFELSKPQVSQAVIGNKDSLTLKVGVSNPGRQDGEEVVQVYVHKTDDTTGPKESLRAFRRIFVKAGEKQDVTFVLTPATFESFDAASNTMRTLPGTYEVACSNSSNVSADHNVTITIH
jgi:beta-glucosidase